MEIMIHNYMEKGSVLVVYKAKKVLVFMKTDEAKI